MTFEEYLWCRKSKTFTPREVAYLLERCGYAYQFIDTLVEAGKHTWQESGLNQKTAADKIYNLYREKVPYYFAYIKFYQGNAGTYALVAGKTKLDAPDFYFLLDDKQPKSEDGKKLNIAELGKDKAKVFLLENHCDWYCQKVLAVWTKEQEKFSKFSDTERERAENLALSVESNIAGLFGLFSS